MNSEWFVPNLSELERSILMAIAYADIFDYPRTAIEVHRYLVGFTATREEVCDVLNQGALVPNHLSAVNGFYTLAGRESLEKTRNERNAAALELWPYAIRYGSYLAALPFVRMVALTGALAVNNIGERPDIDYLIITEPGRLWICRAWVIALVRAAEIRGHIICPNYFLTDQALVFEERNLYTAHELAQMVPLAGQQLYGRIRTLNTWIDDYLPNAVGPPPGHYPAAKIGNAFANFGEFLLKGQAGAILERWEMKRKVQRFTTAYAGNAEAKFSAHYCKGHVDQHGEHTMQAFEARLTALQRTHE